MSMRRDTYERLAEFIRAQEDLEALRQTEAPPEQYPLGGEFKAERTETTSTRTLPRGPVHNPDWEMRDRGARVPPPVQAEQQYPLGGEFRAERTMIPRTRTEQVAPPDNRPLAAVGQREYFPDFQSVPPGTYGPPTFEPLERRLQDGGAGKYIPTPLDTATDFVQGAGDYFTGIMNPARIQRDRILREQLLQQGRRVPPPRSS